MKEWLIKRDSLNAYYTIFKEPHLNDQGYFRRYLRMNAEVYEVKFFKKWIIVIFYTNILQQLKIWIFLLRQENYLLLTSTNFNLLKISLQNKGTPAIYVDLCFLNKKRSLKLRFHYIYVSHLYINQYINDNGKYSFIY